VVEMEVETEAEVEKAPFLHGNVSLAYHVLEA
jgi:hypothetical protein